MDTFQLGTASDIHTSTPIPRSSRLSFPAYRQTALCIGCRVPALTSIVVNSQPHIALSTHPSYCLCAFLLADLIAAYDVTLSRTRSSFLRSSHEIQSSHLVQRANKCVSAPARRPKLGPIRRLCYFSSSSAP